MLVEIEQQGEVNEIRSGELQMWPLIRPMLWSKLAERHVLPVQRGDAPAAASNLGFAHKQVEEEAWNGPRFGSSVVTRAVRTGIRFARRVRAAGERQALVREARPDFLFWSRHHSYQDQFGGRFFNRHLAALIEFEQSKYRCVKVETRSREGLRTRPRWTPTIFLTPPLRADGFQAPPVVGMDGLMRAAKEIAGLDLSSGFHVGKLAGSFWWRRQWFREWLEILQPKAVILGGFFVTTEAALISAARSLGIRTVEHQHGRCGEWNAFFTHWTRIPPEGYATMPDYFWAWGEATRKQVENARTDDFSVLKPIVGGHRWLAKWREGAPFPLPQDLARFLDDLRQQERVILFTLQTLAEPVPPHVVQAMREAPATWKWLLRLHPLLSANVESLRAHLESSGAKNFELEFATKAPLFALLANSHHHVTCSSSVGVEAAALGVPTSLLTRDGEQAHRSEMHTGMFHYAPDADSLLTQIRDSKRVNPDAISGGYIETAEGRARAALELILNRESIAAGHNHFATPA